MLRTHATRNILPMQRRQNRAKWHSWLSSLIWSASEKILLEWCSGCPFKFRGLMDCWGGDGRTSGLQISALYVFVVCVQCVVLVVGVHLYSVNNLQCIVCV